MAKKLIFRGLLLVSIALNLAFLISHWPGCPFRGKAGQSPRLASTQIDQLKEIRQRMDPKYKEIRMKMEAKQAELLNRLKMENPDIAALRMCVTSIADLEKQLQLLAVDEILECKRHLNPEQCACLLNESARRMGFCIKKDSVCCNRK